MAFVVHVEGTPERFACAAGQSVLAATRAAGSSSLLVGCRSGGCGVCRVQVLSGSFETGTMSASQVDERDRANGVALACQLFPRSDLRLRALGRAGEAASPDTAALLRRLCAAPRASMVIA